MNISKRHIIPSLLLVCAFTSMRAQVPIPVKENTKSVLLMNGVAHLGNGKVIENSAIAFKDGKLTMVADARLIKLDKSAFDTIIDIPGKHVYPGFIAPNSTLGLVEIGAVRATRDYKEVGSMNPNVRSVIAYNTDSKITPTIRSNGVLLAQITPRGGRISGTSSVVELEGWNWEDAVYKMDDGIHLNWPKAYTRSWDWSGPGPSKKNKKYNEQLKSIKTFFEISRAYSESSVMERDLKMEAMSGLFSGKQSLYIHVNDANGISQAVHFYKGSGVKKMVIVGGEDSWKLTDLLKENNVAVMVRRVHSKPSRDFEDIDLPYKLPLLLYEAGVLFCLENSGDMEAAGTRNLPFYAGTAIAYGLPAEEAVKSITSSTAKILGIDGTVGTLEVGKDATFIVSTGDALDVLTNNIELAFIQGKSIDLDNHQKQLFRKFRDKYAEEKK
ncbi:amidohydrolase family protein [Flavobacteriales bacterium AH-315-E23]|nr:amidohydrolase family protein [Flavobacteriales bacterium AH-315-E23]